MLEMNLTLGSSWPMYHLLSLKRKCFPLTTVTGSVQVTRELPDRAYFGLQPLQSTSLTGLGAMLPVVAAFAVAEAVAAPAVPVKLSWQMTATPIAGTSNSRHFRPPAGGDPRRNLSMIPALPRECACAILLAHACRQSQSVPRPADHAGVTAPLYETLSDGI